ncbi:hypothetical protein TYRP_009868 [Tyrophagus putrescentiae]|nr:hypothetical protein TYRP_009868 [Tyrophagus putrescentiae]
MFIAEVVVVVVMVAVDGSRSAAPAQSATASPVVLAASTTSGFSRLVAKRVSHGHAAVCEEERDAELVFSSPSFVLFPVRHIKKLTQEKSNGGGGDGGGGEEHHHTGESSHRHHRHHDHHHQGASHPILRTAITTKVLEGTYHGVATAEKQAFLQSGPPFFASPFFVDHAKVLKRAFTDMAVHDLRLPPTRIAFNLTANAEYQANPKSVVSISISLPNLQTGELSTARMMLPVRL